MLLALARSPTSPPLVATRNLSTQVGPSPAHLSRHLLLAPRALQSQSLHLPPGSKPIQSSSRQTLHLLDLITIMHRFLDSHELEVKQGTDGEPKGSGKGCVPTQPLTYSSLLNNESRLNPKAMLGEMQLGGGIRPQL